MDRTTTIFGGSGWVDAMEHPIQSEIRVTIENRRKRKVSSSEKEAQNEYPRPNKRAYSCTTSVSTVQEYDVLLGSDTISNVAHNSSIPNKPMSTQQIGATTPNLRKHSNKHSAKETCCPQYSQLAEGRTCPLPALSWAEANDVWTMMCKRDEVGSHERNSHMLENHPGLQPRMRAILLDWLIEVCEVYKLNRETYYLAVDYLDRFLSNNKKVSKTRLQLIGITCLFIAAKVEQIYPPKIGEFAYVTDGACQEEDILQQELILLTELKWKITPVTIIGWLSMYMQLKLTNRTPETLYNEDTSIKCEDTFVLPQYSSLEFAQTAQLLDLCTLDVGMANFSYSVIAAAAMCFTFNRRTAMKVSGLHWNALSACYKWMEPFFDVICEEELYLLEQNDQVEPSSGLRTICPNIVTDDSHIIQTHTTSLKMFDKVVIKRETATPQKYEASPAQKLDHSCSVGLLTPPASSHKPIDSTEPDDKNIQSSKML